MKRPSARAPAFRERLSDFEATNGGIFSSHGERGARIRRIAPLSGMILTAVAEDTQQHQEQVDEVQIQR